MVRRALGAALGIAPCAGAPARPDPQTTAPSAAPASAGEIEIAADFVGTMDVIRPGEWAGVRLRLTDRAPAARNVDVRLWLPDPDGDTALVTREITLNPGVAQSVWLYAPLGWRHTGADTFTITVHEGGGIATGLGRQIASDRIASRRVIRDCDSAILALGPAPAGGLSRYSTTINPGEAPPTSNELTHVVTGARPIDLPDRWMGLAIFETIVWLEGEPSALSERQAEALREWTLRGGRLVICLPSSATGWADARSNPLHALLPGVRLRRMEDADLNELRPLLRPRDSLPLPTSAAWHALSPAPDATPGAATIVLAAPGGAGVVAQGACGAGLVTLVGLDLGAPALAERIDTQFFWHRVLGKRFDVLSRDEMLQAASRRTFIPSEPAWMDADIGAEIAKQGRASVGVLLGLAVFGTYLVVAGPLSFALLRRRGRAGWAWPVFALIALAFTALAWGSARVARPIRAEIQRLTVLDHVYGEDVDRARVWFGALLPDYGDQAVSIDAASIGLETHDALAPWDNPANTRSERFPDARPYLLDARGPGSLRVPARSTVKEFRADWAGAPPWAMPAPTGGDVRLVAEGERVRLEGRLTHNLPGALTEVVVLLVRGQKPLRGDLGDRGALLSIGSAWTLETEWAAGAELDLATADVQASRRQDLEAYLDGLSPASRSLVGGAARPERAMSRFIASSFYSALKPPDYLSDTALGAGILPTTPARRAAHGLDLSPWLMRPCLIVIGALESGPGPAPLRIDGETPPSAGRTIVRWVYPMPSNPPAPARN